MRFSATLTALLLICTAAVADDATSHGSPENPVDFAHEVLPLIKSRCAKCHTAGTYKGDVSMDTRAALVKSKAIVPGNAAGSELIARITSSDADERMPPNSEALSAEQIALLTRWINE